MTSNQTPLPITNFIEQESNEQQNMSNSSPKFSVDMSQATTAPNKTLSHKSSGDPISNGSKENVASAFIQPKQIYSMPEHSKEMNAM